MEPPRQQIPAILPTTLPIPIVYDKPMPYVNTKQKKNGLTTTLRLIIRFASIGLGKNKPKSKKEKKKVPAAVLPKTASVPLARAHARRNIKESSQVRLRHTFQVAATQGRLRTPVIHVEFNGPSNFEECLLCSSSDFLFVFVGLCNVFVLQFVMVVLLFFSEKEVNLSDLAAY